MTNPWKTYAVHFSARDCYVIDIKARSAHEAIAKAQDRYDRFGGNPEYGFAFDIIDGGTSDWNAEEVVS